ncbi:phosphotransferase family protein [Algihabitans albus]|uniref:phosphotransferase family protein n=1 Tax=Algihabitans albus TaxID=2164067 RepID=UPI000E5CF265|nr:aminoglycoside phosphotransferase family protein [Algihabitans albus]
MPKPLADNEVLRTALAEACPELTGELRPLVDSGLAHDHYRIEDSPWLLRVPKQSQRGYAAADNLAYQAACFERVSASGHGPKLRVSLPPGRGLPMGALVVEYIEGRPPRLPQDLPALAEAMAAVHALPLPSAAQRPPLEDHLDPVAGALEEIETQARYLDGPEVSPETRSQLREELDWARAYAADVDGPPQPRSLVLTDTHPGNFLIRAKTGTEASPRARMDGARNGRAVIVDLEKALYGAPAIDLAHATVYSSTTWDVATSAVLSLREIADFYRRYLDAIGSTRSAIIAPTLLPLRRLLLLRALTWCALWRVEHRAEISEGVEAGWAAARSNPTLIAHVEDRTRHYLDPAVVRRLRGEWLDSPGLESLFR